MKIADVIAGIRPLFASGNLQAQATGLTEDSRTLERGDIFFARKGNKVSGEQFVKDALLHGASAVISEENLGDLAVPFIQAASIGEAEARASENFYRSPSKRLQAVGVTGTNGKTTFTYLLESIAAEAGKRAGVIGTINYRLPKNSSHQEVLPAPNTTPNILEIQKLLSAMVERKCEWAAIEVSSHALALGRVAPLTFSGAAFTNLTQDHLDFHRTMEDYFQAKAKLFKMVSPRGFSLINADDPYGKKLVPLSAAPAATYGIDSKADFSARDIRLEASGSRFTLAAGAEAVPVKIRLPGKHNIYNSLAAAGAAVKLGVPLKVAARGLERLLAVPGRLEPISCGQNFTILVDYAHTEDALKNVLESLKGLAKGRILTLFGCGGDRDRSKRPLMGALAARLSDHVIVTSDNPRSEDPRKITLDIEVGIQRADKRNYEVILDRAEAIRRVLQMAKKDDIVLLAGKGHETYQIFADRTIHFDDREVAKEILSKCSP